MAMNCPQPLESLQATPIPAFLWKTYDLADDPSLDPLISWGSTGHTFVVWDPTIFSTTVLPHCFKHNNFSSFVRQLNTYGFRKVHPDRWEFAHEDFIRGKRHYLKNIHRRRPSQGQHTGSTSGSTGDAATALELEIQHLKKDKTLLMEELVKLQQDHHGRMNQVEAVKRRLVTAEQMQKKVISFLAKLLRNPVFLSHLQNMSKQKQITSPRMKMKFVEHSQAEENDGSPEHIVKLHNIHSPTKSSVQTVDGYHSDNLLQHVVEKVDHGMNYTHSQVQNMPIDEVDEELMPPGNHFEIGGSSLGSLEYEDDSFKENDVVSHQFQACSESLLPYQQDLWKKSTLSDLMSPKVEDIVKHEDGWNIVDLSVSSGMDTSRQDCWMNLTGYDDKEIGSVDGFSNLWDWEFQEAVVDVGVANCLGEEFSLEHLASQAELTQNDLYKNSHD